MSLGGAVALIAVMWLLGVDPTVLLSGDPGTSVGIDPGDPGAAGPFQASPEEEELVQFVSFVLDDLQNTWPQLLPGYRNARLVLFRDATHSACGTGQSEMGPFYCPADEKVYIDLSFYGDLRSRFGAPGDFAQAYVLAHEIGHHVQRLTGIEERARGAQRGDRARANELSVRWSSRPIASRASGDITPRGATCSSPATSRRACARRRRSATTGSRRCPAAACTRNRSRTALRSSAMRWLHRGLESGDPEVCDTSACQERGVSMFDLGSTWSRCAAARRRARRWCCSRRCSRRARRRSAPRATRSTAASPTSPPSGVVFEPASGKGQIAVKWADVQSLETEGIYTVLHGDEGEARGRILGFEDGKFMLVGDAPATAERVEIGTLFHAYDESKATGSWVGADAQPPALLDGDARRGRGLHRQHHRHAARHGGLPDRAQEGADASPARGRRALRDRERAARRPHDHREHAVSRSGAASST